MTIVTINLLQGLSESQIETYIGDKHGSDNGEIFQAHNAYLRVS
jgi:hypothetical protein